MTEARRSLVPKIMGAVLRRMSAVFLSTAAIAVEAVETFDGDARMLRLHGVTAMAGLGPPLGMTLAFSFDPPLLKMLYARLTADIRVPAGEEARYAEDAAAETLNTVLGLCTADFERIDSAITLTPPVVLIGDRAIDRRRDAVFGSMRVRTATGGVSVSLVGPSQLFDACLNYKEDQCLPSPSSS